MYLNDEIFNEISQLVGYKITNKEDLLNFIKQKKLKFMKTN